MSACLHNVDGFAAAIFLCCSLEIVNWCLVEREQAKSTSFPSSFSLFFIPFLPFLSSISFLSSLLFLPFLHFYFFPFFSSISCISSLSLFFCSHCTKHFKTIFSPSYPLPHLHSPRYGMAHVTFSQEQYSASELYAAKVLSINGWSSIACTQKGLVRGEEGGGGYCVHHSLLMCSRMVSLWLGVITL